MVAGYQLMKYALNHPWKFTSYKTAFFAGLIQVLVIVAVESATFYILVFASDAVFDVLANYAIVLVIADFSKNFAAIEQPGRALKLISDEKYAKILKWEVTSSESAKDKIAANELASENVLKGKDSE